MSTRPMLDAALSYADRGIPVFPVRGKLPMTEHGFKDATTEMNQIGAWWTRWPDSNIAMPTGGVSGMIVLDVDPRHGGTESLAALEAKYGSLPRTLEARTGGGGRHLFFALAGGQLIRNSAGKLGIGLDVRGEGGYVVVPPSVHPDTKQSYQWANKTTPVSIPAWLAQALSAPTPTNQSAFGPVIHEGQRNQILARIAGAMRRRGCTREAIEAALLAENERRCNPPLAESEVRAIAQSVSRYAPDSKPSAGLGTGGFKLTTLAELLNEPEEKTSWLLAEKLPAGGISVLSAKPKVGKSTLARCLALAVAKGEPFLGCPTTQGPVIYLALEEKRSEVRQHFSDLGATGAEPIYVHCAAAPQDALPELCKLIGEHRPVLVIIDPLFKFVRVKDEKAYAEVCQAIEPLLALARETGAHVLLVHHNGKADRADATDAILGSTAIFGGVDAALILKRTDRYRTLQSSQRYGTDWPETVLEFDPDARALSLGQERGEADTQSVSEAILEYINASEGVRTEPEIMDSVEGRGGLKRKALRLLFEQGKIGREGAGKRGDAYKYFSFSCSHHITGTRKQESEVATQPAKNAADILVPDSSLDSLATSTAAKASFDEGEL